jgi:TPR repeat protein
MEAPSSTPLIRLSCCVCFEPFESRDAGGGSDAAQSAAVGLRTVRNGRRAAELVATASSKSAIADASSRRVTPARRHVPKQLPNCSHPDVICEICLDAHAAAQREKGERELKCPTCNMKIAALRRFKVAHIPDNTIVLEYMCNTTKASTKRRREQAPERTMETDGKDNDTRTHADAINVNGCQENGCGDMELDAVCRQCNPHRPLCADCARSHRKAAATKGHATENIEELADRGKRLATLSEKSALAARLVAKMLPRAQESLQRLPESSAVAQAQIWGRFGELQKALNDSKQALLAQLDKETAEGKDALQAYVGHLRGFALCCASPSLLQKADAVTPGSATAHAERGAAAAPLSASALLRLLSDEQQIERQAAAADDVLRLLVEVAPLSAAISVKLPHIDNLSKEFAVVAAPLHSIREALALEKKSNWLAAIPLWQRAVELDDPSGLAMWKLSWRHHCGWGVSYSLPKAKALLQLYEAKRCHGVIAEMFLGSAPSADDRSRFASLQHFAAAKDDADLLFAQGYRCCLADTATGTDKRAAVQFWEQAARLDHAGAMNALAVACESGQGVEKNLPRARELYESAANAQHALALNHLGRLLHDGCAGSVEKARARDFYQLAAKQGVPAAELSLGLMC